MSPGHLNSNSFPCCTAGDVIPSGHMGLQGILEVCMPVPPKARPFVDSLAGVVSSEQHLFLLNVPGAHRQMSLSGVVPFHAGGGVGWGGGG